VKFLIDNALSQGIARLLAEFGHDAVHVRDYGLHAAEDSVILNRAGIEERVVVSADSDFAMLLALSRRTKPSFILFREADIVRPEDYGRRLLECLPILEPELDAGCVVTFRRGRIRVRTLPISSTHD
jgi:predicted nuclease of predicted toxin-antitoxin system